MKKLILLFLLLLSVATVDAQKKYKRKIRIETSEDNDKDSEMDDEDDDDTTLIYDNDEDDDDMDDDDDDVEVISITTTDVDDDGEEVEEEIEFEVSTKPIGKYFDKIRKKKKAVEFEPFTMLGWNNVDLESYEGGVFGNIQSFSDMNFKTFTSWYVGLYPVGIKVNLYDFKLKLITGLGFQFYNYKFSDSVNFSTVSPYYVGYGPSPDVIKTKLGSSYLSAPLMLSYQTSARRPNFSIAGGLIFGYRLKTWTKMNLENGSKLVGPKGNYNFNDFVYSAVVMVGFKEFKVFGTYMLTPMHRANTGFNVNAYPWSFGLIL